MALMRKAGLHVLCWGDAALVPSRGPLWVWLMSQWPAFPGFRRDGQEGDDEVEKPGKSEYRDTQLAGRGGRSHAGLEARAG